MPGLSRDQVAFYRENGYLVVERALSGAQLERLRADIDRVMEGARGREANDEVYDLEDTHTPDAPRVRRIKLPHKHVPFVHELVCDPNLTDPVADLIGQDLRLRNSKLNTKSAGYGAPVEWHQDWAFYPHTNDDVLALGVMLDDVDESNGPLLVVPGSHRGPVFDHHAHGYFCGAIDPETPGLGLDRAVPLTGPAGSITLHHARLVHGSALNRSGRDRRFLLYEITAADAWPLALIPGTPGDLAAYDATIIRGAPTLEPRLAAVPVRMPLPPAPTQGSIYENQKSSGRRYFETLEPSAGTAA